MGFFDISMHQIITTVYICRNLSTNVRNWSVDIVMRVSVNCVKNWSILIHGMIRGHTAWTLLLVTGLNGLIIEMRNFMNRVNDFAVTFWLPDPMSQSSICN